jgi:hypothetical protein
MCNFFVIMRHSSGVQIIWEKEAKKLYTFRTVNLRGCRMHFEVFLAGFLVFSRQNALLSTELVRRVEQRVLLLAGCMGPDVQMCAGCAAGAVLFLHMMSLLRVWRC